MAEESFEKIETHETRYVGRLDAEALRNAIEAAVRTTVGLSPYARNVNLSFALDGTSDAPELSFTIVQDHRAAYA